MKRLFLLCLCLACLLLGCVPGNPEPAEELTQPSTEIQTSSEPEPETTVETTRETTQETTEAPTEPPQPEYFTLSFAGDCTLGCNKTKEYSEASFLKVVGDNYGYPFSNVVEYFANDDFTLINLEGTLTNGGKAAYKEHVFRGYPEYTRILTCSSVEAVSLANNHTMDYGVEGYESTTEALSQAGVAYVEKDCSLIYTTESGLTIGMYAVTYERLKPEEIYAAIGELAANEAVDLVIFVPHWGTEYSYRASASQIEMAHGAIDAGADIVCGSHAHVLQPIEEYNGGIIYYSLGNFCFGGMIYPHDFDSVVVQQEVIRDVDGTVRLGQLTLIPCCISSDTGKGMNDYRPTPYEPGSEEYERVLAKLNGTYPRATLPFG